MGTRRWELVATNESTVIAKSVFYAIVMEDRERNGGFPDSGSADESNRFEAFSETDYLLDQPPASETGPRRRGRRFSGRGPIECKTTVSTVLIIADLI